MSFSSGKKKECIFFCNACFIQRNFFNGLFIPMYSVLKNLSGYIYFYISKSITSYPFLLVSKIVEKLQCVHKFLFFGVFFLHFRRKLENYLPMIPFSFSHSNKFIKNKCSLNKIRSGSLVNIRFILNKTAMEESIIKAGV